MYVYLFNNFKGTQKVQGIFITMISFAHFATFINNKNAAKGDKASHGCESILHENLCEPLNQKFLINCHLNLLDLLS